MNSIVIGEEIYSPVLKTGDRFTAKVKGEETEFEFVGFAPFDNCGCQYVILKNIETGNHLGVEHLWFDEAYCGRKITLLDARPNKEESNESSRKVKRKNDDLGPE